MQKCEHDKTTCVYLYLRFFVLQGHIAGQDESILYVLLHVRVASSMVQHQTSHQAVQNNNTSSAAVAVITLISLINTDISLITLSLKIFPFAFSTSFLLTILIFFLFFMCALFVTCQETNKPAYSRSLDVVYSNRNTVTGYKAQKTLFSSTKTEILKQVLSLIFQCLSSPPLIPSAVKQSDC